MRLPRANRLLLPAAAASAFAAAELVLALTLGGFPGRGRAEILLFLAWRPWLLVLAAALVSQWPLPRRWAFYLLALALAALCEALLVLRLGNSDPWTATFRGAATALLLLVPLDLLAQAGRRLRGRFGAWIAAAAAGLLLAVPGVRAPYEAAALGPPDRAGPGTRPRLLVMTGLPIVWGEYGPFDPRSRPSQSWAALKEEFEVEPVDVLDPPGLARSKLLLLAQPRWLAPSELAAFDSWVRRGGRAVILADPDLVWPSDLPLGDVRRPVASSLLGPLLGHWGLSLRPPAAPGPVRLRIEPGGRLVALDSPGTFVATGRHCTAARPAHHARCSVGAGKAVLLADADLLRDDLWAAPGRDGGERSRRLSDNPLHVADLLDEAAGLERSRARAPVAWADAKADYGAAVAIAFLPILALLAGLSLLGAALRFKPRIYPQGPEQEQERN